jgi:hypothetical protein
MGEKEYIIPYRGDARKRHEHKATRGKVTEFVVQLEVRVGDEWKAVVRYDCAHGYAHRDSYSLSGTRKKRDLNLRFEDALTLADGDIDDNWEVYKGQFLEGELP